MSRKATAEQVFTSVEPELQAISKWMYDNPELGYQEFESSRKLAEFLGTNGFEVTYPAYGLETSFEATIGSTGPRVVICCEYDALPEVGHACGHNIIATAALGAGIAAGSLAEDLGMRVTVLGTPAEEAGGGKVALIDAGAFADAAASMMIHPGPDNTLDPSFQARESFTVEFFGKDSHAAFAPQAGINALDGFVQAYLKVATLRQQILGDDRIHCIIDDGGDASNIIPSYTKSTWGIRAATNERLQELIPKVKACFEGAAIATGCRLELTLIALQVPGIFAGAIITEQIFRINGLGQLLITSINSSDIPMVQTLTFLFAVLIVIFNLVADVTYGFLDPRIRYD